MLIDRLTPFFERLGETCIAPLGPELRRLGAERLQSQSHGDLPGWTAALETLPRVASTRVLLDTPCVSVDADTPLPAAELSRLRAALQLLHPWRKGPFCLHGVQIDAEWRSDLKWDRVLAGAADLRDRLVVDVGCGNGYYGYRALGAGARLVLGIDPTLRFVLQFLAVEHLIGAEAVGVLPLADTDLPADLTGFDTVLSMGVLYHRRDPALHLRALRRLLRPGGELILETLVLDAPGEHALRPRERYAKMRNVHEIPTPDLLRARVAAAGFSRIRIADVSTTTISEQRATEWMRFESLADFLDPADQGRTVEGHPAPRRAVLIAERRVLGP